MHEANTIVVEFSNGVYRVATYPEGDFSLIPDRKGNTETPDVFYWSETGGVSAGYPPESYAVYQDRYLDGIFDNIATSAVLPGLSGSDCMTLTICQILQDTESFLRNPVQRILFLVPFNTPYFHLALLKTACKKKSRHLPLQSPDVWCHHRNAMPRSVQSTSVKKLQRNWSILGQ